MTLNIGDSTPIMSRSSPVRQVVVVRRSEARDQNSGFSRREFVGMAAASLLMAGGLNASAPGDRKNGIPCHSADVLVKKYQ